MKNQEKPLRYCLYARKSSESEDRQSASIDAQISELKKLSEKQNLNIVYVIEESKSAKSVGKREGFENLLYGVREKEWDSILTWAPDRLSRNAGDMGKLIDMMDTGKLKEIRTIDQVFGNKPDEKFLLMILCSQAKLENDNRGKNVKRGMAAMARSGRKPGKTPIGYKLWRDPYDFTAPSKVQVDPERAALIKEMFKMIGDHQWSAKDAFDHIVEKGFTNRKGKVPALSTIYILLKEPFYYGEFEYPKGSGNWHKGVHKPIISKALYERVQTVMDQNNTKKDIGGLSYYFKRIRCNSCHSTLVRTSSIRGNKRHTYVKCYKASCGKCDEKPIRIKDFFDGLAQVLVSRGLHEKIKRRMERFHKQQSDYFLTLDPDYECGTEVQFINYLLMYGNRFDRFLLMENQDGIALSGKRIIQ